MDEEQSGCRYCEHESVAYRHYKDDMGRDVYRRVAEPLPFDDGGFDEAEPLITWPEYLANSIDYADNVPRLAILACNRDGDEEEVSIPIFHCPVCGRRLPTCKEVYGS